jgi:hypothetical protein
MIARPFVFVSILSLVPAFAFAQEGGDAAKAAVEGEKKDTPPAAPEAAGPSSAPQDRFKIKRGFFAQSDLGVFLTFGGRNTNNPMLPSRVTSNIQPHLGVVVGYDVVHSEAFSLSLGLRFAMGLSGGAGRVTSAELGMEDVTTKSNDFSVIEAGGEIGLGILATDRLAVTIKVDGGAGIVDPDPSKVAGDPCNCAGAATFAPTFGAGAGIEFFTLLNDFSVGFTMRFQGVLVDGLIPGASFTIPIKYTF